MKPSLPHSCPFLRRNNRPLCTRCIPVGSLHHSINEDNTKKECVQKAVCNCITCSITHQAPLTPRSAAEPLELDHLCQHVLVLCLFFFFFKGVGRMLGWGEESFVPFRLLGRAVFAHSSDMSHWGLQPPSPEHCVN